MGYIKAMFVFSLIVCFMVSVSVTGAYAFGMPKLPKAAWGSASDTNWDSVEDQSKTALADLYSGQSQLSGAVADLAIILGLKEEAAELRAQVQNLDECGSSSCPSFDEVRKVDKSLTKVTLQKLEQVDSLTDDQKEKSSEALKKYAVGGILYAKGLKDVKSLSEKAMDAPAMQKMKFVGLVKAAPVALKGATSLIQTAPKLFQLATAKDVKTPDGEKNDMMSSLTM